MHAVFAVCVLHDASRPATCFERCGFGPSGILPSTPWFRSSWSRCMLLGLTSLTIYGAIGMYVVVIVSTMILMIVTMMMVMLTVSVLVLGTIR